MRIMIDAHMLGEQEGGNETYIAGLLRGFEACIDPTEHTITALYRPSAAFTPPPSRAVRYQALPPGGNLQRLGVQLPRLCAAARADLLHVTYNAPLRTPCPTVVSVHDVIFRRFPEYFSPRVRLLLSTLLPLSMRRAAVILTLSDASKRDIIHYYPFTRHKIIVTPLAAGPVAEATPAWDAAAPYAGRPFVLAVGTVQPRKNMTRLIQAYTLARQRGDTDARLVVVGRAAWRHSAVEAAARSSAYHDDIVFTGYLPDAAVAALYQRCAVCVYPSLYEGFGLPVVEAMACGAPVITSDRSSLPEVAGDAALLVDPYSVEALSAAIAGVLSDQSLRAELRARGQRQAAQFSWARTAQETLAAYASACTDGRKD